MIHIIQNPKSKKYDVVTVGSNGEYLNGTKQGFERKSDAWKNIFAVMKVWDYGFIVVQDDTPKPKVYNAWVLEGKPSKEEAPGYKPIPAYKPKRKAKA